MALAVVMVGNQINKLKPSLASKDISILLEFKKIEKSSREFFFFLYSKVLINSPILGCYGCVTPQFFDLFCNVIFFQEDIKKL